MEAGRVAEPARLRVHGVEFACSEDGSGPPLLLVHETGATAAVWDPLADLLAGEMRVIAFDRRGWGESGAPEPYARTTVEEQAEDAAGVLAELAIEAAVLCGAGLGAVAVLDLLLRRRGLVSAAVLIEPPLLALVPEATEGLSGDRGVIEKAVADGGPAAALDLYLRGGLPFLGPGAGRIPAEASRSARRRPLSLFAELATVPAWSIPTAGLAAVEVPSLVVVGAATPLLLQRAAEELAGRLAGSELVRLESDGLPHVEGADELAPRLRALRGP